MSKASSWFFRAMHKEPVVMWSVMIGAVGVALPIVVPRESFFTGDAKAVQAVPKASDVARAMRPTST